MGVCGGGVLEEEVRMGAGVDGGGVIPLWKMYWSSWKNRSPKKEKSRKI